MLIFIIFLIICFGALGAIKQLSAIRFTLLLIMFLFLFLQLFAINLPMMRSMLFSFELGYKMFACIVIYITSTQLLVEKLKQDHDLKFDLIDLHFINLLNIGVVFLITNHDAWRMPNTLKLVIVAGIILAYIYFWCLAFFQKDFMLGFNYQDILWKVPVLGMTLSLRGLLISSLSNLIIFFGKQEWNMTSEKNKSSIYALKPRIRWIVDWQPSDINHKYHKLNSM